MYGLPSPKSAIVSTSPRSRNASGRPLAAKLAASVGGGTWAGQQHRQVEVGLLAGVGERAAAQRRVDEGVHADTDRGDGEGDEQDERHGEPRPESGHLWPGRIHGRARPPPRGLVAGPAHGQDQRRRGRVGLDLRPQPPDGDVDQPRVAEVVVAPDAVEQQVAGEHLARVARRARRGGRTRSASAGCRAPSRSTVRPATSIRSSPSSIVGSPGRHPRGRTGAAARRAPAPRAPAARTACGRSRRRPTPGRPRRRSCRRAR